MKLSRFVSKKLDRSTGLDFQRRFTKIVVGKDKASGRIILFFKSENNVVLILKTDQRKLQDSVMPKDGK